jgi:hypothetical protein
VGVRVSSTNDFDDWAPKLWKKQRRRQRLRHVARRLGIVAAAGGVLAAAVAGVVLSRPGGPWSNDHAAAPAAASTSSTDTATEAPTPSASPTPTNPFVGTVAASYPVGSKGIVTPAARAVGGFSAAQVADAYQRTRAYLIAANLNPRTLAGSLDPLLATLPPTSQQSLRGDLARDPGAALDELSRFSFGVVLSYPQIRVKGTMSAAATADGHLEIQINYVFAYPLRSPSATDVVVLHRKAVLHYYPAGAVSAGEDGLYPQRWDVTFFAARCDAMRGGYLAPDGGAVSDIPPDPRDPSWSQRFDPSAPMAHHACPGGRVA